jgi:hypothetical protein
MRRKEYLPLSNPRYNVYHEAYDRGRLNSDVLNGGGRNPNIHSVLQWDRNTIKNRIFSLTGDEKGCFDNPMPSVTIRAEIPALKIKLAEFQQEFLNYQQTRVSMGYPRPKDDQWPPNLLTDRLTAEASLDVKNEELTVLQDWLEHYVETDTKSEDSLMLQFGLLSNCQLFGTRTENPDLIGTIKSIDMQAVSLTSEGLPYISDERSPYAGLLVSDYRTLAEHWRAARRAADQDRLVRMQEVARELGQPVPQELPFRSRRKVDIKSLPKFPDWAKNYKTNPPEAKEPVLVEGVKRVRKPARAI